MKRARDLAVIPAVGGVLICWQYARFAASREGQLGLLLLALMLIGLGITAIARKPKGATRVVGPAVVGIVLGVGLSVFAGLFLIGALVLVK